MRKIGDILNFKKNRVITKLDDKSIYYFFNKVVEKEYGNKGLGSLKPDYFEAGKIFVKAKSSVWANELWLNREEIKEKINKEIGSREVVEIKIKN
jgi:hypothetical protein